jgi:hypothetical protein
MEYSYEARFSQTEIQTAITSGGQNRAPYRVGFYKANWPINCYDLCHKLNTMFFFEGTITTLKKRGTIVYLP